LNKLPISYDDVVTAHRRIAGIVRRTPTLTSATADALTGARLFFKCENFQRMGAFKFRGACNAIAQLSAGQKAAGVIAYSSGNHAQAVALAAKLLGTKSTIVMPSDAPAVKVAATRAYGGDVVSYERYREDREALARRIAGQCGLTLIPPFDHPHVMAGQGTTAKELFEDTDRLDILLVPLGGGGLLSGCAVAARVLNPECAIIGVEPEAGNDGQRSLRTGSLVRIDVPITIADGAADSGAGKANVRGDPPVSRRRGYGQRRRFGGDDALFCEPNEAGGRTHGMFRSGCGIPKESRCQGKKSWCGRVRRQHRYDPFRGAVAGTLNRNLENFFDVSSGP
jgi:threo-3-hydroxy-L-aspartate ammonia-lyase